MIGPTCICVSTVAGLVTVRRDRPSVFGRRPTPVLVVWLVRSKTLHKLVVGSANVCEPGSVWTKMETPCILGGRASSCAPAVQSR